MREVTQQDIETWKAQVEAMFQKHHTSKVEVCPHLEFIPGKVRIRIAVVRANGKAKSAFGFLDPTTGDLYKAASWKAPAKGIRGNIFGENPLQGVDWCSIR